MHLSATPARVDRPAPLFGEHTREVLRECDFGEAEIDELLREGIIAEAQTAAPAP